MILRAKMAVSALVIALTAGSAVADSGPHHGDVGGPGMGSGHDVMEMMMRMHGMTGASGAMPGIGMMGGRFVMPPGMDMMGPGGSMMGGTAGLPGMGMMSAFDEDGDGVVTPEEASTTLSSLLSEYDADSDGALSIGEFETLHSALNRETTVDRFQHLDADGDGAVTKEEMVAPALEMQRIQALRERMMDGIRYTPGEMMRGQGPMDGSGPHMQRD